MILGGFINTAVMAMSGKKPEEAIFALSPHSEKFSGDFTVQYLLGTAYYQIKDYKKSKVFLSNALIIIYPQSRNTKNIILHLFMIQLVIGKNQISYTLILLEQILLTHKYIIIMRTV